MAQPTAEQIQITKNKRIELLFAQGLDASSSGVVVALFISTILFVESQNFQYLVWGTFNLMISGMRFFLCKSFTTKKPNLEDYDHWVNRYLYSSSMAGIAWGSLMFIDLEPLSVIYQLLSFMALAYITFGMVATYSAIMKTITWSLIFMLLVITTGLILIQDEALFEIALLFWITLPFGYSTSKKFNHIIIQSLTHQLQVEKLYSELELSNQDLEVKVAQRTEDLVLAKDTAEQAKQASSEFLANMTHELRTPLHAILSFSKLGNRKKLDSNPEKKTEYFNKIHHSGERLLELMENLLELSKYDAGKADFNLQSHSLNEIINDIVQDYKILMEEKSLHFGCFCPPKNTVIMLDKIRIEQVVKNLLSNAIKFSPDKGKITINLELSEMVLGRRDTDTQIVPAIKFSIDDEGIGIPENELSVVFDKFIQSTKTKTGAGGTGLGLAICKEVIEGHSGKIWAENKQSNGARFIFVLPLMEHPDN